MEGASEMVVWKSIQGLNMSIANVRHRRDLVTTKSASNRLMGGAEWRYNLAGKFKFKRVYSH